MTTLHRIEALALAIAAAGAAVAGSGCHSPLLGSVSEARLRDSGKYHLVPGLDVPAVRGPEGCGAQALATVLAFGDPDADAEALAEELPWHRVGATPVDLLLSARDHGLEATVARGTWDALAEHARAGRPVLVMFNAGVEIRTLLARFKTGKVMHWAVVSGMARDGSRLLLAARRARHHVAQREDFLRRWSESANCMIVVERLELP